jgi:hypothetical protein
MFDLSTLAAFRDLQAEEMKSQRIYSRNQLFETYDRLAKKVLDGQATDYYTAILAQRKTAPKQEKKYPI